MSENAPLKKPSKRRKKPENLPLCRLEEMRGAQNKSIRQLAAESGVHRNLIASIEMGAQEGIASNHLKLVRTLGVSADEYFGLVSPKLAADDKADVVESRKGFTVEIFPSSQGTVRRIALEAGHGLSLKPYLDSKKPVFFYVIHGELRFQRSQEIYEQGPNAAVSFPRANDITVKNNSSFGSLFLAFQS